MAKLPQEINSAAQAGGNTTVMVWADVDDNMANPDALKAAFWTECQKAGITQEQFCQVVFACAEDRLENWVEFLNTGSTDESREGPRVKDSEAVEAARKLADKCSSGAVIPNIPASLAWSCQQWRTLKERMG